MIHRRRPFAITSIATLVAILATSAFAHGQSEAGERDVPPKVTVVEVGDGTPVLLRWRESDRSRQQVVVATRTLSTTAEKPGIDATDPAVILRGMTRPPLERQWTIEGQIAREQEGTRSARWRVLDGAARIVGVRGYVRPEDPTSDGIGTTDGDGDEAPAGKPGPLERFDPRDEAERQIGSDAGEEESSDAEALARAVKLERLADAAVGRTGAATMSQAMLESGLNPSSLVIRFPRPDARAEFEADGLLRGLRLAEVQLPVEPVAVGGSWTSSWKSLHFDIPTRTEITWTLVEVDEAADATGVAESGRIRVEYRRRIIGEQPRATNRARSLEADGRGEVVVRFDQPLMLEARLVEQPIAEPRPGRSREVTRYRLFPIGN